MRARNQKEISHIIGNYYEIAGKGWKYTKKIATKYVLCISIARYIVSILDSLYLAILPAKYKESRILSISYVQIHCIAKKS